MPKKQSIPDHDPPIQIQLIERRIYLIRGQKVMLDRDLAELYQVKPIALRQQVKRNLDRFPDDFMFQLTAEEAAALRCQTGTLMTGRGRHRKTIFDALRLLEATTSWAYPEGRRLIDFRPAGATQTKRPK